MVHKSAATIRTPRRMSRAPQPAKPNGTWFAEPISASGQNRANRPNTRLLLTNAQIRSKMSCYAGAIHTRYSVKALHKPCPGCLWLRVTNHPVLTFSAGKSPGTSLHAEPGLASCHGLEKAETSDPRVQRSARHPRSGVRKMRAGVRLRCSHAHHEACHN